MRAGDREVVDLLVAVGLDGDDLVPQDGAVAGAAGPERPPDEHVVGAARRRPGPGPAPAAAGHAPAASCSASTPRGRGPRPRPAPPRGPGPRSRRPAPTRSSAPVDHQLVPRPRSPRRRPRPSRSTVAPTPKRSSRCCRSCASPALRSADDQPAGRRPAAGRHTRRRQPEHPVEEPGQLLAREPEHGLRDPPGLGAAATPWRRGEARQGAAPSVTSHVRPPPGRVRSVDPRRRTGRPGTRCRWPPRGSRSTAWGRRRRCPAPRPGGRASTTSSAGSRRRRTPAGRPARPRPGRGQVGERPPARRG